jgi:hypothetical protein
MRKGRGTDVEPQPSRTQENLLLLFLTADLLARPSGFAACRQGRYQRGPAALPLRGLKVPGVDRAALKEKDRASPLQKRREPATKGLLKYQERNPALLAEDLKD